MCPARSPKADDADRKACPDSLSLPAAMLSDEVTSNGGSEEVEARAKGADGGYVGVALEGSMSGVVALKDTIVERKTWFISLRNLWSSCS